MARSQTTTIVGRLCNLFSAEWIQQEAVSCGLIQRKRKVKVVPLFWTLVLGFGVGVKRTIASLRREYEKQTKTKLVRSSFYDRFNKALVELLKAAVERSVQVASRSSRKLRDRLEGFRELLISDATVLRVHHLLRDAWKSTGKTGAAVKMHVVFGVLSASPKKVTITGQRVDEKKVLKIGRWVKDRLLLMDLGYYKFALFERIDAFGGYFVSRLRSDGNPLIIGENIQHRGQARQLVGCKLRDVLSGLQRQRIDVQVKLNLYRSKKKKRDEKTFMEARLVGLRDEETGEYHLYLTNVPPERLTADDIRPIYAARWQIELLFRQLKTYLRGDQLPSSKKHVVLALLYTAILAITASRAALDALRLRRRPGQPSLTEDRWSAIFHENAHEILQRLLRRLGFNFGRLSLEDLLLHQAFDPNRKRRALIELAEGATY